MRQTKSTRSRYGDKPAPMAYSAQYWAWREAIRTGKGVAAAAQAHYERVFGRFPGMHRRATDAR